MEQGNIVITFYVASVCDVKVQVQTEVLRKFSSNFHFKSFWEFFRTSYVWRGGRVVKAMDC